jgi:hypothetical protein
MRACVAVYVAAVAWAVVAIGLLVFLINTRPRPEHFTSYAETPDLIRGAPAWAEIQERAQVAAAAVKQAAGPSATPTAATSVPPSPLAAPPPSPSPPAAPIVAGTSKVTILEPTAAAEFIRADADRYVAGMTPADLRARRVFNAGQYLAAAANTALDVALSPGQKQAVAADCAAADRFFARYLAAVQSAWPLDGPKIANIPWTIAFTNSAPPPCNPVDDPKQVPLPNYEDGLPHTRGGNGNVVFLPIGFLSWSEHTRVETLIHEKVHIYQRTYPDDMAELLARPFNYRGEARWFAQLQRRNTQNEKSNVRSNPDTDKWFYGACRSAPPNGLGEKESLAWAADNCDPMGVLYTGAQGEKGMDGPNCITDVDKERTPDRLEHPFEVMAYDVGAAYKEYLRRYVYRRW